MSSVVASGSNFYATTPYLDMQAPVSVYPSHETFESDPSKMQQQDRPPVSAHGIMAEDSNGGNVAGYSRRVTYPFVPALETGTGMVMSNVLPSEPSGSSPMDSPFAQHGALVGSNSVPVQAMPRASPVVGYMDALSLQQHPLHAHSQSQGQAPHSHHGQQTPQAMHPVAWSQDGSDMASADGSVNGSKVYSFVPLSGVNSKKRPRRRFDEIERLYVCNWGDCEKAYGTLNHLNAHVNMQKHGPKRLPAEFKELRKAWRRHKRAEEEAAKQAAAFHHQQNQGQQAPMQTLCDPNRYVLRGSVKTDRFQLQLLAYKTKVLHSVKYRRLDESRLPPRISTTVGGTDYYMMEIRNVIRSAEDVTRLWNCKPEEVTVLGIDLGKAMGDKDEVRTLNLAVNQRAVYQPIFKYQRWSEHKKSQTTSGGVSIKEIESDLPPLRGDDADVEGYVSKVKDVEATLVKFYSDDDRESWKRHKFDLKKAFDEEFRVVADCLWEWWARSLGYVVCDIDEFYTSKRCPRCENFAGQVTIRRLYCPSPTCQSYVHRDILGGHNIANIAKYRLTHGERPLYLQPIDSQGRHLWTNSGEISTSSGGEPVTGSKRSCPE
ncbi:hypothetical protein BGZ70_006739 [Mortierella alpina]|uniref:C2H2-type domain-containing protein n=1 Tax=Mortierella alpina TaxID=64518 RepID=A0A9P6J7U4_MORAP|nr:hypothetical protein BGZ70_006739 [Mortierella alpina]